MLTRSQRLISTDKKYSDCFKEVNIKKSMITQHDKKAVSSIKSIKLNTKKVKSSNIIDLSNDSSEDDKIIDDTEFDITTYMNSIDDSSVKIIKTYLTEITPDMNEVFYYIQCIGTPKYLMQKFINVILIFCPNAEFTIKQIDRSVNELKISWKNGEMNDSIYFYTSIEEDCIIV